MFAYCGEAIARAHSLHERQAGLFVTDSMGDTLIPWLFAQFVFRVGVCKIVACGPQAPSPTRSSMRLLYPIRRRRAEQPRMVARDPRLWGARDEEPLLLVKEEDHISKTDTCQGTRALRVYADPVAQAQSSLSLFDSSAALATTLRRAESASFLGVNAFGWPHGCFEVLPRNNDRHGREKVEEGLRLKTVWIGRGGRSARGAILKQNRKANTIPLTKRGLGTLAHT